MKKENKTVSSRGRGKTCFALTPRIALAALAVFVAHPCVAAEKADVSAYNIVWTSPSANSSESMPCGGGDIGLNVWVENGDILFYIARSGTFDENGELLKLGRVRLTLTPALNGANGFKQVLHLDKSCVSVSDASTEALLWVDVFRPVIHVAIKGKQPVSVKAAYENWRYEDFVPHESQFFSNSFRQNRKEVDVKTRKDVVEPSSDKIVFYHRNRNDVDNIFDFTVRAEWLEDVKAQLHNPARNRTFGGYLQGGNLKYTGVTSGRYLDADYKSYNMESARPSKTHQIEIGLHTDQSDDIEGWKNGLEKVRQTAAATAKTARKATLDWWTQFWNRSYVFIEGNETDEHWQIARNYMVFRYQLACNGYGEYPTKFNGGLFTFDPSLVNEGCVGTPDHRNWTGSDHVVQNQRLVYWNMLKSGDSDMMKTSFDFYLRALKNAELRSKVYWNHAGACFSEHTEYFGLPSAFEYFLWGALDTERPDDYDKGVEYNPWVEYEWETVFEFCMMIMETERYENKDIHEYIPLIESCLTFYDEHYRYLAGKRGSRIWDSNGHYVFYPTTAGETYKMAYNSTTVICALRSVLARLLELPPRYLTAEKRGKWEEMLKQIPPFRCARPTDIARNTYWHDLDLADRKTVKGWQQWPIWAARLGLTDEAADLIKQKMKDSGHRFPTWWGPGYDWLPDHNWGGSGMIGLQEMLLQADGEKIYILPAFPKTWDVSFKLHAPYQTTVEVTTKDGKITELKVTPEARRKDVITGSD